MIMISPLQCYVFLNVNLILKIELDGGGGERRRREFMFPDAIIKCKRAYSSVQC